MTKFVKKDDINSKWFEIDAKAAVVGRLATIISKIIRGKNKTTYTPHMDHGDFVVVKNIDQIKFTGNKFENKKYYRHTGYPGGIKETTPERLHGRKPGEVLKLAVKRMLPVGPLAKKQLTKLVMDAGLILIIRYIVNLLYIACHQSKLELEYINAKKMMIYQLLIAIKKLKGRVYER